MRARIYQPEIMDEETVDQETADEIYRYLASINRLFGGVNGTIARFEAFSRSWRPGERRAASRRGPWRDQARN